MSSSRSRAASSPVGGRTSSPVPHPSRRALDVARSSERRRSSTVRPTLEQYYEVGDKIGAGAFSVVKLCKERTTGDEYAVKCLDKARHVGQLKKALDNEIAVLSRVEHPNILKLRASYESMTHVYIVTELLKGGELMAAITERGKFGEDDARNIIRQLLEAVAYLHDEGIVHRDIKPENILLVDDPQNSVAIKLTDFGLAAFQAGDMEQSIRDICGTPHYMVRVPVPTFPLSHFPPFALQIDVDTRSSRVCASFRCNNRVGPLAARRRGTSCPGWTMDKRSAAASRRPRRPLLMAKHSAF